MGNKNLREIGKKLMDLANYSLAGLTFASLVAAHSFNLFILILGVGLGLFFYSLGILFLYLGGEDCD